MQCATASARYCEYYKYCDQTYAAKHFSSGNALSIIKLPSISVVEMRSAYKTAKHFSSGNALSIS